MGILIELKNIMNATSNKTKNNISKNLCADKGSVSIEALFVIPVFIFTMMVLIFTIRFIAIDDSFNQCLYESVIDYSNLENSSSDTLNTLLINMILQKNLADMDLELETVASAYSIGNYVEFSATYKLNTPINKEFVFYENLRIYKSNKDLLKYVYITPNGKKYHYKDCLLTKGNGLRYPVEDVPIGITACKNCILEYGYFQKK